MNNNFNILKDYIKNVCNSYIPEHFINPQHLKIYIDNSELEITVNFYDYDGTILYTYDKDEFLSLTELPPLPTQPDLICQGWNWDLDRAKEYVGKYGNLNIGATYTTDDGKTRFYIELLNDNVVVSFSFSQTVSGGTTIDWGDGSSETVIGTTEVSITHTYSAKGEYVISLSTTGECKISLSYIKDPFGAYFKKVEVGDSVTAIGEEAFSNCNSLQSITIPDSVTTIGTSAFSSCSFLQSITIPDSVTSIGDYILCNCHSLLFITIPDSVTSIGESAFKNCYSLQNAIIGDSVTSIGESAFEECYSLQSITIPDSVTSIDVYAFYRCYSLQNAIIGDSVTTIGSYAFSGCHSLQNAIIGNSVTSIGNSAFLNCRSLQNINIPDSVTTIGASAFQYCYSLQSITIPDSVTTIGNQTFQDCHSLQSITIPDSVTKIGNSTFSNCYSLRYMDFTLHTSIPTLGTNVFKNVPSGFEIWVFTSLYDDWCNATNWSRYKDNIVAVNPTFSISHNGEIIYTSQFENGMTWWEYLTSDYCTSKTSFGRDGMETDVITFNLGEGYSPRIYCIDASEDDVIENNRVYRTESAANPT